MLRLSIMELVVVSLALGACALSMFPTDVMNDVDSKIDFETLKAKRNLYKGRAVQLAGRIIDVEQTQNGPLIVARNLPIKNNQPSESLMHMDQRGEKFAVLFPGAMSSDDLEIGNVFIVVGQLEAEQKASPKTVAPAGQPYLIARCLHVWENGGYSMSAYPEAKEHYVVEHTYCSK